MDKYFDTLDEFVAVERSTRTTCCSNIENHIKNNEMNRERKIIANERIRFKWG